MTTRTDDVPASCDEHATLTTFLDYARDTVHARSAGLTDENARLAPLPGSPLMTMKGASRPGRGSGLRHSGIWLDRQNG